MMDETYIKMRLAAIPELGMGVEPDRFFQASLEPSNDIWLDAKGDLYVRTHEDPYWCQLERQDQLQAMYADTLFLPDGSVDLIARMPQVMAERFAGFCSYDASFTSMDQLWLALTMKELHSKSWIGTEWKGDSDGKGKEDQEAEGDYRKEATDYATSSTTQVNSCEVAGDNS